ncbi:MAG: DNA-binding transcriptional LysR family regulator [Paracoccaceae bacterium]
MVTRTRNRRFLTPMGERLAFHAQTVRSQLRRAEVDIEAMGTGLSGRVRIGSVTSLSPIMLPGATAMFQQTAP